MQLHVSGHWSSIDLASIPPPTVTSWLDQHPSDRLSVYLSQKALQEVVSHLCANVNREHGGFLLGNLVRSTDLEQDTAYIHTALPCPSARGSMDHLTFDHDCWQIVHTHKAVNNGSAMVVGWFHSHPGMTLKPSLRDEFIQKQFFFEPWQIAWIMDPRSNTHAFYTLQKKVITRILNVGVVEEHS